MTATDTHTESHATEHVVASSTANDGLFQLVASNDHKMVGRLWILASLLFLVGLSILGVINDVERADAGSFDIWGSATRFFQSWVLFRTGIIFMVVLPLFLGLATSIVPLQVGSASIAFPRLAGAAFWTWLFASIAHIISFLADGGLGAVGEVTVRADTTQLTITSLGAMIIALLAASMCIATTVIALRPTGMTLVRVPMFSWSMLVATSVWLLSLPVLIANLIFSWVDLSGFSAGDAVDAAGQPINQGEEALRGAIEFGLLNTDLWERLEWAWSQPRSTPMPFQFSEFSARSFP